VGNYFSLLGNGTAIKAIVEAIFYRKEERQRRAAVTVEALAKAEKEHEAAQKLRLQNVELLINVLRKAGIAEDEIQRRVRDQYSQLSDAKHALDRLQSMVDSGRIQKVEVLPESSAIEPP